MFPGSSEVIDIDRGSLPSPGPESPLLPPDGRGWLDGSRKDPYLPDLLQQAFLRKVGARMEL